MGHEMLQIIAGHREEEISSLNEWWGELRRGLPLALPIIWWRAERLPGVSPQTRVCAAGRGSRRAPRSHQIIGRAPPHEAVCQRDSMRRKTYNFSRWFAWWTNSMPRRRSSARIWELTNNTEKSSSQTPYKHLCVWFFFIFWVTQTNNIQDGGMEGGWLTADSIITTQHWFPTVFPRNSRRWQIVKQLSIHAGRRRCFLSQ